MNTFALTPEQTLALLQVIQPLLNVALELDPTPDVLAAQVTFNRVLRPVLDYQQSVTDVSNDLHSQHDAPLVSPAASDVAAGDTTTTNLDQSPSTAAQTDVGTDASESLDSVSTINGAGDATGIDFTATTSLVGNVTPAPDQPDVSALTTAGEAVPFDERALTDFPATAIAGVVAANALMDAHVEQLAPTVDDGGDAVAEQSEDNKELAEYDIINPDDVPAATLSGLGSLTATTADAPIAGATLDEIANANAPEPEPCAAYHAFLACAAAHGVDVATADIDPAASDYTAVYEHYGLPVPGTTEVHDESEQATDLDHPGDNGVVDPVTDATVAVSSDTAQAGTEPADTTASPVSEPELQSASTTDAVAAPTAVDAGTPLDVQSPVVDVAVGDHTDTVADATPVVDVVNTDVSPSLETSGQRVNTITSCISAALGLKPATDSTDTVSTTDGTTTVTDTPAADASPVVSAGDSAGADSATDVGTDSPVQSDTAASASDTAAASSDTGSSTATGDTVDVVAAPTLSLQPLEFNLYVGVAVSDLYLLNYAAPPVNKQAIDFDVSTLQFLASANSSVGSNANSLYATADNGDVLTIAANGGALSVTSASSPAVIDVIQYRITDNTGSVWTGSLKLNFLAVGG